MRFNIDLAAVAVSYEYDNVFFEDQHQEDASFEDISIEDETKINEPLTNN